VFNQPLPRVNLPVYGVVCDINPVIPEAARSNIGDWVEQAQGIFGISEFTARELRLMKPRCAGKIGVVPLAAGPLGKWNPPSPSVRHFDFYFPAAANLHKNHLLLFKACAALAEQGNEFRLALSGPGTECFLPGGNENVPAREAGAFLNGHRPLLEKIVTVRGNVARGEVESLYADTRCVVLPTGYEGFGLPLAEAIQRGLPVICSDIAAHLEQLERDGSPRNARTFEVGNLASLIAAMAEFLKRRNELPMEEIPAGGSRWTWEDSAQRCFELLARPESAPATDQHGS
jgi:glycosyltransferase involved in cell wall biosynthesis